MQQKTTSELLELEPWRISVDPENQAEMGRLDAFAALYHSQWAEFFQSLLSRAIHRNDGSIILPGNVVKEAVRLKNTPYAALSDADKDFPRNNAVVYMVTDGTDDTGTRRADSG